MAGVHKSAKKRMVGLNDRNCVVGQDHPRAVLTDHDVELLLALRDEGFSYSWLARKFEVTKMHAWRIVNGVQRGHVATRWVRR